MLRVVDPGVYRGSDPDSDPVFLEGLIRFFLLKQLHTELSPPALIHPDNIRNHNNCLIERRNLRVNL